MAVEKDGLMLPELLLVALVPHLDDLLEHGVEVVVEAP